MQEQEKTVPKMRCPVCGNRIFEGRKCTNCNHQLSVPVNPGKPGKGSKCPICASFTVFADRDGERCEACGAMFVSRFNKKKKYKRRRADPNGEVWRSI